ncbi:enoyl-CoA hydratase/isomerase family protein [Pseudomonas fluorescens]|uniref:enoyl-CoA hydratase/isomerase family protein n=1 Tax=Pseudomonas fluorescens group TaxID=136843 RepID=UPI0015E725EF|nr:MULTISPECIES: enoyl-CoA hydratase/isomerase family protein [Pseudomonas fluorescens group]MBA1429322.1 enoyl-CoA hydratase/isomerase family protein [Pseudomonas orientalis]MBD8146722.1 enoyl-CoA hydratase/isomerase family protein [Pseudomonas fluorescens]MBD8175166.1 enoyl-CoA hydratase/isomerase family protein [Pseudomonas fluorescens]MBD8743622.1 enoyl-CoA hydratase/isomerase family protein [Pseudomonas fluorescens]MBD8753053.1 enoyl-CoA hydratase/isomerase family protein [Pseudomonas flu
MNLHFEELTGTHGARIGIASLDAQQSLNALSLPMILALSERLDAWAKDPNIVCVLLRGNGSKAFCAGGEVRSLAMACREQPGVVPDLAAQFFAAEYRLDYRLHTYPKPLICWGHGYVLGGGMGLLQSASVRIVTPSSRLAMPEISIGLYPDVGASWFLSRLPGKLGLFLGLTGAHINGRDALDLGLADRFLRDDQQDALLDGLLQLNWQEQTALQLNSLLKALAQEGIDQLPEAQWLPRRGQIDQWLDVGNAASAWRALSLLKDHADPLVARAGKTLNEGCPLTARLVWEQIRRARHLSLAQVFQMEYTLSLNCCRHPEFAEGVRARLIDKDQAPRWHWRDINTIPEAVVQAHFDKAWEGRNPLADLSDY